MPQTLDASPTTAPLKKMFDGVPRHYDLINRLFTFGFDERWRKTAAEIAAQPLPQNILELGCGTGDYTLHLRRATSTSTEIVALDFSPPMLEAAALKISRAGYAEHVRLVEGNAAALEFGNDTFDCITSAFSFRNMTWHNPMTDRILHEVLRVLKPGGRLVVVETSQPRLVLLRRSFHAYLNSAVSQLGGRISGARGAYRYLATSASQYFDGTAVICLLQNAGFVHTQCQPLLGGLAAIHSARKRD